MKALSALRLEDPALERGPRPLEQQSQRSRRRDAEVIAGQDPDPSQRPTVEQEGPQLLEPRLLDEGREQVERFGPPEQRLQVLDERVVAAHGQPAHLPNL